MLVSKSYGRNIYEDNVAFYIIALYRYVYTILPPNFRCSSSLFEITNREAVYYFLVTFQLLNDGST